MWPSTRAQAVKGTEEVRQSLPATENCFAQWRASQVPLRMASPTEPTCSRSCGSKASSQKFRKDGTVETTLTVE